MALFFLNKSHCLDLPLQLLCSYVCWGIRPLQLQRCPPVHQGKPQELQMLEATGQMALHVHLLLVLDTGFNQGYYAVAVYKSCALCCSSVTARPVIMAVISPCVLTIVCTVGIGSLLGGGQSGSDDISHPTPVNFSTERAPS